MKVVENRVLQVVHVPLQFSGNTGQPLNGPVQRFHCRGRFAVCEDAPQGFHLLATGGLVQGDADPVPVDCAQIEARLPGAFDDFPLAIADRKGQRVEERLVFRLETQLSQALAEDCGQPVNSLRDPAQPQRAVVHRVEGGHDRQQGLGRADVAGGFLPANMLFAGLHGHAQRLVAAAVDGYTDDAARGGALVGVAGGEEGGVRPAESHGYAEALAVANHHVRAHLARGLQQKQ